MILNQNNVLLDQSCSISTFIVLPHLKCGGTERTAAELANFIARNGGKVSLLLMFRKEKFYKTIGGVEIFESDIDSTNWPTIIKLLKLVKFIRSTIKKKRPDVVLALGYIAFTLFATLGLRTKVIMSYRSNPERLRFPANRAANFIYNLTHTLLKGRVDGIIAQTNATSIIYRKKYTCPVITIHNFLREIKHYDVEKRNIIINIGHLTADKAQHFLIRAFSMLCAPDWELLILGEGPKHKELMELCKELNVDSKVRIEGYQKDVDKYLSMSKIFAFSSIVEGYPNALIEAMAIPLPVVSFDCNYGPSEIIRDGENGFLVRVADTETFALRLQELIDNPHLRKAFQSESCKIRMNNHIDTIAPQYIEFFISILH